MELASVQAMARRAAVVASNDAGPDGLGAEIPWLISTSHGNGIGYSLASKLYRAPGPSSPAMTRAQDVPAPENP